MLLSLTTDIENQLELLRNPINIASTNQMASKCVVEKLTYHNYRMWRTRMELKFEKEKIFRKWFWSNSINKTLSNWKSRDLDARMEVIMHLSDRQVDHVRSLGFVWEMWYHLQQLHQPPNSMTKIFSYWTLMNMEMFEGEPTYTFISNWQKQLGVAF